MERFHGKLVVTGAGIGRWGKDTLLYALQKQVNPHITPQKTRVCFAFSSPVSTLKYVNRLKQHKTWIQHHRHSHTFKEFFLTFFPFETYRHFCWSNGYTDFEDADIVDTLYDYGFEDNSPGQSIFSVSWNAICRSLRKQLRRTKISLNTEFQQYTSISSGEFQIITSRGKYSAQRVCFAGTIEKYPFPIVHQQIGYNSFLRMYVFFDTKDKLHSSTTYTSNHLQKRIKITPHIHMLSYSDNRHARSVNKMSTQELEDLTHLKIKSVKKYFWKHGTHYYKPLDTSRFSSRDDFIRYAQNPVPNVFLVGEVISRNQGWTEGALESVHRVLPLIYHSCSQKNENLYKTLVNIRKKT
jgi:hypothetical protein